MKMRNGGASNKHTKYSANKWTTIIFCDPSPKLNNAKELGANEVNNLSKILTTMRASDFNIETIVFVLHQGSNPPPTHIATRDKK